MYFPITNTICKTKDILHSLQNFRSVYCFPRKVIPQNSNLWKSPVLAEIYPPKTSEYFSITNIICKQWANYISCSPFLRGCGGHVILKGIKIGLFNYAEPNGYLKILIRCHCGKKKHGSGIVALQTFWSLKKDTRTFNFRSSDSSHDLIVLFL